MGLPTSEACNVGTKKILYESEQQYWYRKEYIEYQQVYKTKGSCFRFLENML